jgi:hypothetical protein
MLACLSVKKFEFGENSFHSLLTWPRGTTRVGAHDIVRENGGE